MDIFRPKSLDKQEKVVVINAWWCLRSNTTRNPPLRHPTCSSVLDESHKWSRSKWVGGLKKTLDDTVATPMLSYHYGKLDESCNFELNEYSPLDRIETLVNSSFKITWSAWTSSQINSNISIHANAKATQKFIDVKNTNTQLASYEQNTCIHTHRNKP